MKLHWPLLLVFKLVLQTTLMFQERTTFLLPTHSEEKLLTCIKNKVRVKKKRNKWYPKTIRNWKQKVSRHVHSIKNTVFPQNPQNTLIFCVVLQRNFAISYLYIIHNAKITALPLFAHLNRKLKKSKNTFLNRYVSRTVYSSTTVPRSVISSTLWITVSQQCHDQSFYHLYEP